METRTTVYKKTNETYMLKMKASRALFTEVSAKCGTMPFSLRNLEDEKKARMGIVECVSHKLVEPFTVLYEKPCESPFFLVSPISTHTTLSSSLFPQPRWWSSSSSPSC